MKKKLLTFIMISIFSLSLAACGQKEKNWNEESESLGEINMDNTFDSLESEIVPGDEEEIGTTYSEFESEDVSNKEDVSTENEEDEKIYYVNIVKNNISDDIKINTLTINGKQYTLPVSKEAIEEIKECSYASAYVDTLEMYFVGSGWGIQSNPDDIMSFDGGKIFFMYDDTEENIIAAKTSDFWIEDDLKLEFAGISIGDTKESVESLLGEGEQYEDLVFYKNNTGLIAIEYELEWNDGEKYRFVEEIYIFGY